jgi:protein-tyrosine phosphatase
MLPPMFSIFRKSTPSPDAAFAVFSRLGADMHSHFIPGIDDGARDMGSSLKMIRGLAALGYRKIITTPHVIREIYPNTPANIRSGYQTVLAEWRKENSKVEFLVAAEYLMDEYFSKALETDQPLLTLKDKLILVELSFAVPAINLKEILFQLQMKGYQPVLAHPERYLYFGANKAWYGQLRDTGCLFQLNLLSFRGHYGKVSLELAEYLVKKRWVDYLGTDIHHEGHLEMLSTSRKILQAVNNLLDTGLIRNPSL